MSSGRWAILFGIVLFLVSCQKSGSKKDTSEPLVPPANNVLTAEETGNNWELLFDGSTLNGWKRYNAGSIGPLWSVENSEIVCSGKGLNEGTPDIGGSLTTIKQHENFDLYVEWKIGAGGNSGILYHVREGKNHPHEYETGPEYQLIDEEGWKGEPLRDVQKTGSSYDMYAAPTNRILRNAGEWNSSRLIYTNGHVEHWLNGVKILQFDEAGHDFMERYKKSKWTQYPDWNKSKDGSICLQDHGARIAFRNIKIRAL